MSLQSLLEKVERLPVEEKWQLVKHLLNQLEVTQAEPIDKTQDWHEFLRATYGILRDDPIERPEQPPLEDRDPLE
jgi:hypothetical protein